MVKKSDIFFLPKRWENESDHWNNILDTLGNGLSKLEPDDCLDFLAVFLARQMCDHKLGDVAVIMKDLAMNTARIHSLIQEKFQELLEQEKAETRH